MHAAEVAQHLPVVRIDDTAMSAVRAVVEHGLPGLVVTDEADRIAARLVDVPLRQVVTGCAGSVPEARAEATLAELAELMGRRGRTLALVRSGADGSFGVVTVHRLLEAFVAGVAGERAP